MDMNHFSITVDEEKHLTGIYHNNDPYKMNWVKKGGGWGTTEAPEGISVRREYKVRQETVLTGEVPSGGILTEDILEEVCSFTNQKPVPVYFTETDLKIMISLPDYYTDAAECMVHCCHTHLWCGGDTSWIGAFRMGGEAPHLGMVLREGSFCSYSIMRDEKKSSNDRGSFILHPDVEVLQPGESYTVRMWWFWFQDRKDFYRKVCRYGKAPIVRADRTTLFPGEAVTLSLFCPDGKEAAIRCERDLSLQWKDGKKTEGCVQKKIMLPEKGEYILTICTEERKAVVRLFSSPEVDKLLEARCRFICRNQQETKGTLNGAYLIYDRETGRRYYSALFDHNGGRERVGMGALLALWLQTNSDPELTESLNRYTEYVYRELLDCKTGEVFNDCGRNQDWDRLYNYPWMSVFLMELFRLRKEDRYLLDAWKVLKAFYVRGGDTFYAIGLPVYELISLLEEKGYVNEAEKLRSNFLRHAEYICSSGRNFPKSEVNYEQSIVAPAISILLQAFQITGRRKYADAVRELVPVLLLFHGDQPDYHLFGNAIRHWDGYWFGKRRMLGDTFPHYWSVLTGVALAEYERIFGDTSCHMEMAASLRGVLNLFFDDGFASCAMVYPRSINGKAAHYYDPWANDQDWALYYCWKYRAFLREESLHDENEREFYASGGSGL